ncbi:MAG: YeiH family putative sulfate export transporter, partial [Candidatus Hydrothermarchaeota archaeon]
LGMALLSTFVLSNGIVKLIQPLSTIAFSITLASIGFSVNMKDVQNMKLRPLIAAYGGWIFSLALFLVLIKGGLG